MESAFVSDSARFFSRYFNQCLGIRLISAVQSIPNTYSDVSNSPSASSEQPYIDCAQIISLSFFLLYKLNILCNSAGRLKITAPTEFPKIPTSAKPITARVYRGTQYHISSHSFEKLSLVFASRFFSIYIPSQRVYTYFHCKYVASDGSQLACKFHKFIQKKFSHQLIDEFNKKIYIYTETIPSRRGTDRTKP